MLDQHEIYQQVIFETLGPMAQLKSAVLIAAGNHNQGIKLETSEGVFFLKLNFDHERNILAKESEGLKKLRKATFLKIPETFGYGRIEDYNYLLSEFIPSSRQQLDYWEDL
jgi:fructosamine-3-kinase